MLDTPSRNLVDPVALVRHETGYAEFVGLCAQCGAEIAGRSSGRPARFCGNACRCAAYRRRQRNLPEDLERWSRPRGRSRMGDTTDDQDGLSRHHATAREVEALLGEVLRRQRRR